MEILQPIIDLIVQWGPVALLIAGAFVLVFMGIFVWFASNIFRAQRRMRDDFDRFNKGSFN